MSDTKYYLSKENAKALVDGVKQNFSPISHTHTKNDIEDLTFDSSLSSTSVNAVQNKTVTSSLNSKVPTSRTINGKALTSNITLNATDVGADPSGSANSALANAKTYADGIKNDLLNGAGAAYDTLKELGDLIDDNKDAIDALEEIASGKANASHTHSIANITNLQSALDGKASTSHGTHVTYSTTTPVMDGTASVGSASTVARSDHKHPTDTSRASQEDLRVLEAAIAEIHEITNAEIQSLFNA